MSQAIEVKACPKCGSGATNLVDVDAGMKLILQQNGLASNLPGQVCASCYQALTGQVSQGVKLRIEKQHREKNRHLVWKSRVNLIKHARQMMAQKAYSEAAVSYEKYVRVLEIAYDLKPGTLSPDVFGKSSRSKELTVIATTYWDLYRIYDTHPKYRDRMRVAAKKLAEFLPYSTISPDVIKKAQAFASTAKNPDIALEFLRISKAAVSRCFVATAAFGGPNHKVVLELRDFRDAILMRHPLGQKFVRHYYQSSPPVADIIRRFSILKYLVRPILYLIAFLVRPLVESVINPSDLNLQEEFHGADHSIYKS
jgi:hypothetical protein